MILAEKSATFRDHEKIAASKVSIAGVGKRARAIAA
jgi:hypothetical protein